MKPWEEEWEAVGNAVYSSGAPVLHAGVAQGSREDRARLAAAAPEMARLLVDLESLGWRCVVCDGFTAGDPGNGKPKDHRDDCALVAALVKAGVRRPREVPP